MAASGTSGDVAAVEDVQVEAQVGEVEVHGAASGFCGVWAAPIAGKPAPTGFVLCTNPVIHTETKLACQR
ncbi:hypothetical protein GCM10009103_14060 [Pseudomonas koreensis]|nr:hypothetical protein GCM10009103_14060 [Pseudomonas koreensis]